MTHPNRGRSRVTSLKWPVRFAVPGIMIAASLVATASGSAGGTPSVLNISDEYGITWTCQFNPYNASDEFDSFGPVYEELVYIDNLKSGSATPWLATAWGWSNGNKTLTFTIRKGVT